ncbi:hypothetical protein BU23DRAFT_646909 [Bimuria novae-zelandiae CBS 107.79]|uniref:Uncharacterized protein n=1 Tax=Bimuria novae-zelandiae CBS 107.79 TaxID=1447943 RepID=A0A6A5V210_9PLEO|nr:hypothetical protein BU23DRAFT_646909 [Bimuria novae-zelandiae CBS 107.79]
MSGKDETDGPAEKNQCDVLYVRRSMMLAPNMTYKILPASEVTIRGRRFPVNHLVIVQPMDALTLLGITEDLTATFARGWEKLPTELKVMIVKHAIVKHYSIRHPTLASWKRNEKYIPKLGSEPYYSLLLSTPDLSTLAKEIFYKHNTFFIRPRGPGVNFPVATAHLARKLFVGMDDLRSVYGARGFLRDLSEGRNGFSRVEHIEVDVSRFLIIRGGMDRFEPASPIWFKYEGRTYWRVRWMLNPRHEEFLRCLALKIDDWRLKELGGCPSGESSKFTPLHCYSIHTPPRNLLTNQIIHQPHALPSLSHSQPRISSAAITTVASLNTGLWRPHRVLHRPLHRRDLLPITRHPAWIQRECCYVLALQQFVEVDNEEDVRRFTLRVGYEVARGHWMRRQIEETVDVPDRLLGNYYVHTIP